MREVLFVCTANVCRSPMAVVMFNVLAEEGGADLRASSAGVAALEGRPMTPESVAVLAEMGVDAGAYADEHRARRLTDTMLEEADLVLTMEPWHVAKIREALGEVPEWVDVLPRYVGAMGEDKVSDPYGRSMAVYRAAAQQIFGYVDLLVKRAR